MYNPILACDSYKASHYLQYPPNTTQVYSYVESRGGTFKETLFFGLQIWLKEYLSIPVTEAHIKEAKEFFAAHGEPFNEKGWQYIVDKHKGMMPVCIKAVPEGTVVPIHNVLATITNTDPKCYWLPSYLETQLLRAIWYPTTVATISWQCKQLIKKAIDETSDIPDQLDFKLHDFGARGVSSTETAAIGGAAHLVNFKGSDTVEGVVLANRIYREPMSGFSVPAAEHSTMTSWGRDRESDAYKNMLDNFAQTGKIVAVVSDSYDIWKAIDDIWTGSLRKQVEESGATVVVRPDSGDPLTVPIKVIQALMAKVGSTINSKGFKVLPPYFRVIQGDGITVQSIQVIINNLKEAGLAIDNLTFGMGGGLLQKCDRDTQKFAFKTSCATVDGVDIDVFKSPIDDPGKTSKKGRLALIYNNGKMETVPLDGHGWEDLLQTVYLDGRITRDHTLQDIRERSLISPKY